MTPPFTLTEQAAIDAAIAPLNLGRALDIATGRGGMISWLIETAARFAHFTGIDEIPLPLSRQPGDEDLFLREDIEFKRMDAHQMSFEPYSFDTVSLGNALHHMHTPAQVMAQIKRVLKPGGCFILSEMYSDYLTPPQITQRDFHHWWAGVDRALGITHNPTHTRAKLIDFCELLEPLNVEFFDTLDGDEDPFDAERHEFLRNRVQTTLEKAHDLPDYDSFAAQAEDLLRRLAETGVMRANVLVGIVTV